MGIESLIAWHGQTVKRKDGLIHRMARSKLYNVDDEVKEEKCISLIDPPLLVQYID